MRNPFDLGRIVLMTSENLCQPDIKVWAQSEGFKLFSADYKGSEGVLQILVLVEQRLVGRGKG
jgi:hypothetical protein